MGRPKSTIKEQVQSVDYVGTKDAAAILGVSVSSIQKMVDAGTLTAWRTTGGHRRLSLASVKAAAAQMTPAAVQEAAPQRSPAAAAPPLKILLVEDNTVTLKALDKIFGQLGDRVVVSTASDAAEALLKIADQTPHLVITDLAMEPFDGFHLIRVLRTSARLAHTAILVVTGLSDEEIKKRGGLDPAIPVYQKPLQHARIAGFVDAFVYLHYATQGRATGG